MKVKSFPLLFFLIICCVSYAQPPEKGKPGSVESYRVQEYYNVLASDNKTLEGPYELWYKGIKLVNGSFSNGEKTGLWKFNNLKVPYINSQGVEIDSLARNIFYQGYYQNDKKNGPWKYFLNQKPLCTIFFKDNLRDSTWRSFYKNGKPQSIINYKTGKFNGTYEYFSENGTKLISKDYSNDQLNGKYMIFYGNGDVKVYMEYVLGNPMNVIELKGQSNNKLDPGTIKDGTGTLKYYDKQDRLIKLETYKNGIRDGLTEKYYATSGKILEKGTYLNGKKNNDWIYLKEDGSPEKTITIHDEVQDDTLKMTQTADYITLFADERPQPQGGDAQLQSIIESNVDLYDLRHTDPRAANIKIMQSINFAVSATGKIYAIDIPKGFDNLTTEKLKTGLRSMPPWIPAFDNGFPVEYLYRLNVQK